MKMRLLVLFCVAILGLKPVLAEEGMLIPSLIAAFENDMKAKGMKLSAADIYSVNNTSIKDAIFQFGGGCTAELVSDKGLLLTNHHCGFGTIQANSTTENDYLTDGFWAMTKEQEIPADFGVWFLNDILDVTDKVLQGLKDDMTLMVGGFGLCGIPENAIQEMVEMGVTRLTCISNRRVVHSSS